MKTELNILIASILVVNILMIALLFCSGTSTPTIILNLVIVNIVGWLGSWLLVWIEHRVWVFRTIRSFERQDKLQDEQRSKQLEIDRRIIQNEIQNRRIEFVKALQEQLQEQTEMVQELRREIERNSQISKESTL